jgi:hypothetical protein
VGTHVETHAAAAAAPAVAFRVDGEPRRFSLAEMLEANADDAHVCGWLRAARPGDVLPGVVPVECIDAGALSDHARLLLDVAVRESREIRAIVRTSETVPLVEAVRVVVVERDHLRGEVERLRAELRGRA